jgi:hypothetical protein
MESCWNEWVSNEFFKGLIAAIILCSLFYAVTIALWWFWP